MVWHDLSDDELAARLEQRGASFFEVFRLVANRDETEHARVISELLD